MAGADDRLARSNLRQQEPQVCPASDVRCCPSFMSSAVLSLPVTCVCVCVCVKTSGARRYRVYTAVIQLFLFTNSFIGPIKDICFGNVGAQFAQHRPQICLPVKYLFIP